MHTSMHMYAYVYYHIITSGMYDINSTVRMYNCIISELKLMNMHIKHLFN